jgi:hypothetical protein
MDTLSMLIGAEQIVRLRSTERAKFFTVLSRRVLAVIGAQALIGVLILAPAPVEGQVRPPAGTAKDAKKTWTPPRTPDGQPDLQGVWTNATITPLERPSEFAGKAVLTPQEAAEYEKRIFDLQKHELGGADDLVPYNEFWTERNSRVVESRRTSLIVDPPDGKVPPLTPEAKTAQDARAKYLKEHPYDGPENLDFSTRCITRGLPQLPAAYNSNHQIVQAPGYVVVLSERIHDARVIPLDGSPHVPPSIRSYLGDPRGHWEGNTLVVDTTNFTEKYNFRGSGRNLHLIERFTRVDADTINYEFTIDDPTTFTRPWTAQLPLKAIQNPMYEYACHEGNYGMTGALKGARLEERKAAEEAAKRAK